jgi:hypothetical protein
LVNLGSVEVLDGCFIYDVGPGLPLSMLVFLFAGAPEEVSWKWELDILSTAAPASYFGALDIGFGA